MVTGAVGSIARSRGVSAAGTPCCDSVEASTLSGSSRMCFASKRQRASCAVSSAVKRTASTHPAGSLALLQRTSRAASASRRSPITAPKVRERAPSVSGGRRTARAVSTT